MNKDLIVLIGVLVMLATTAIVVAVINNVVSDQIDQRKSEDYRKCLEVIQAVPPTSRTFSPHCSR